MEEKLGAAERQLRDCILEKYRSVRACALALGLPCSTVNNVLRRGVGSVTLSTASVLCEALGLDAAAFVVGEIRPAVGGVAEEPWAAELLEHCQLLDEHGRELVLLVARKERERCAATVVEFPRKAQAEGWRQYLGAPIACRGGGVTAATEEDARQMDKIYRRLLAGRSDVSVDRDDTGKSGADPD